MWFERGGLGSEFGDFVKSFGWITQAKIWYMEVGGMRMCLAYFLSSHPSDSLLLIALNERLADTIPCMAWIWMQSVHRMYTCKGSARKRSRNSFLAT